jgi:ergosteryl-3beta-O-L-aspartate synthase
MPGTLKKHLLGLNRLIGHSTAKNHMTKVRLGDIDALDSERASQELAKGRQQYLDIEEREHQREVTQAKKAKAEELVSEVPPEIRDKFGSKNFGAAPTGNRLSETMNQRPGDTVAIMARIHQLRSVSAKMLFIVFRQQVHTIQGVLEVREGEIHERFVRWAAQLNTESLVYVEGTLRSPPQPVKTTNFSDVEIIIERMFLLVSVNEALSPDVAQIDHTELDEATGEWELVAQNRARAANRIAYLRTPTAQSVFRIGSQISSIFRSFLEGRNFLEIFTPKLQSASAESGAEVFQVPYFGRTAVLAQSPQLSKQMAISSDFGRVFEVGPVFRAEDSNTHRHLTEYTGLDLEMAVHEHYHEALDVIDELLKFIFTEIYEKCRREIEIIKSRFPHKDLVWLRETPRLTFKDAVGLLNESGWKDSEGNPASNSEDLGTRAEIRLGQLVKEKYKTDYFILDKFPASARPFYTHLDPDDAAFTNSFDIFLRGQEVATGGQRINDSHNLVERIAAANINPDGLEEYIQAFECGVPPHAGCGIGLERLMFLLLGLGDVRNASLFPRDPRSFPERSKTTSAKLRHPEANTLRFAARLSRGDPVELPAVEELIANYGDATNTSWLDPRYSVWRHCDTGAAVGFAEENGYALIMGNPLCDVVHYAPVIEAFLKHLRSELDLRPLWLLVSPAMETLLAERLGWRTLTCVAEERVDTVEGIRKDTARKIRQAHSAGLRIRDMPLGAEVPDDLRKRVDECVKGWEASRTGPQVHITSVRPWDDVAHRQYLWAEDSQGKITAIVVLHQLSPDHGFQIKWALDFPGAPSGAIEAVICRALDTVKATGATSVTFGVGASPVLEAGVTLAGGMRARILSRTYKSVAKHLDLVQKSNFREKFGAVQDPVYICYPSLGLGVSGARTLIRFFESEL